MATSRATIGSLFAAVQTTANTAVAILNAGNKSIGMVNGYVDDVARRQAERSLYDQAMFSEQLENEVAQQVVQQEEEIITWCNEEEGRQDRFKAAQAKIKERVAALSPSRK